MMTDQFYESIDFNENKNTFSMTTTLEDRRQ